MNDTSGIDTTKDPKYECLEVGEEQLIIEFQTLDGVILTNPINLPRNYRPPIVIINRRTRHVELVWGILLMVVSSYIFMSMVRYLVTNACFYILTNINGYRTFKFKSRYKLHNINVDSDRGYL
ncbi:hypothetical protein BC833DRAFT_567795 [Globomyces pollinis-pini]|nr:hypothetical protein BC833DRAFT_567795 [Globomyces pollinis-pini]